MCQYFDSGHKDQHVFVLHGLGGAGKSQLAFKFLEDSKAIHRYDSVKAHTFQDNLQLHDFQIFRYFLY